jgi:hypothetical protein
VSCVTDDVFSGKMYKRAPSRYLIEQPSALLPVAEAERAKALHAESCRHASHLLAVVVGRSSRGESAGDPQHKQRSGVTTELQLCRFHKNPYFGLLLSASYALKLYFSVGSKHPSCEAGIIAIL